MSLETQLCADRKAHPVGSVLLMGLTPSHCSQFCLRLLPSILYFSDEGSLLTPETRLSLYSLYNIIYASIRLCIVCILLKFWIYVT